MSNNYSEESAKTKKTREKLKSHFDAMDQNITKQALERKLLEIHRWIARHAPSRIVLRSKTISLFDENQNAAKLSNKVTALAKRLNLQ